LSFFFAQDSVFLLNDSKLFKNIENLHSCQRMTK
jgi:hypothetical protein